MYRISPKRNSIFVLFVVPFHSILVFFASRVAFGKEIWLEFGCACACGLCMCVCCCCCCHCNERTIHFWLALPLVYLFSVFVWVIVIFSSCGRIRTDEYDVTETKRDENLFFLFRCSFNFLECKNDVRNAHGTDYRQRLVIIIMIVRRRECLHGHEINFDMSQYITRICLESDNRQNRMTTTTTTRIWNQIKDKMRIPVSSSNAPVAISHSISFYVRF